MEGWSMSLLAKSSSGRTKKARKKHGKRKLGTCSDQLRNAFRKAARRRLKISLWPFPYPTSEVSEALSFEVVVPINIQDNLNVL